MDGVITTDTSKSDGRLKVGVSSRGVKKKMLKKMIGRGGPGLGAFRPVGYGKSSFSSAPKASGFSVGSSKKIKSPSIASLSKSLIKKSPKFKTTSFKSPAIRKIKNVKMNVVKGLVKSIKY
jgi:hypothetical protein